MEHDGLSPAQVYDREIVRCIFSEWTPALIDAGKPAAGEQVLDLACGTGTVARAAAAVVGPVGTVIGVDVNPGMLDVARAHPPVRGGATIDWRQASAEVLPVDDAFVDVVLCQQGLQFFPDRPGAIAEMRRVLRAGGRVALSVWAALERNPVHRVFNDVLVELVGAPIFTAPFGLTDPDEVERLLRDGGFASIDVREETRYAHFDDAQHFAEVHVLGAAAVIPAFAAFGGQERSDLIVGAVERMAPVADTYRGDDGLVFPMASLVATARKP